MEILGLLAVAAAISSAVVFKDEGTIEVRSFALKGVKSIEASQLKEVLTGFDVIPPDPRDELKQKAPLRVGQPREHQLVLATRELALDELRDHGYPYAKVEVTENDGPTGKEATLRFAAINRSCAIGHRLQLNPIPGLLLNGKEQTRRWRIHFSIGQAF